MRVLWVLAKLEWDGGIGRIAKGTLAALSARGHDVHAAGPLPSGRSDVGDVAGVSTHAWPKRRMKLLDSRDIVRAVRASRPDVVHFNSALPHGEQVAVVRALSRGSERPRIVVTPHTSLRASYPKRRARWGLRLADAVVCTSQWSADCAEQAGADPAGLHVVHNGIDEVGSTVAAADRDPWVLFLARLTPVKGPDVLIDAFDRVATRHPTWRLRMAGDGSARDALATQIAACANGSRIELLGKLTGAPKVELLQRSAIGVLPTLAENFPGTLLEFQAHGLACIASDVGGIPELAEGGKAAVLVPPSDPAALAEALDALMSDASRRAELSSHAVTVTAGRSWDDAARRYEEIYRGLLGEG